MKKVLCLILCALMLMATLVGCGIGKGDDPANEPNNSGDVQSSESSDVEDSESETRKELVAEDFSQGGVARDYNILVRAGRFRYLHAEEDVADRVAHSAWERNNKIQSMFGIDIRVTELAGSDMTKDTPKWITALQGSIQGDYDLCMAEYWMGLDLEGLLTNILTLDEIDTSAEYWYQGWNDHLTINGKLYSITGDVTNEMIEQLEIIYFNKFLAGKLPEEYRNLYQLVDDGEWTLETFDKICKQAASGLDDEDKSNDIYGAMYDIHSVRTGLIAMGLEMVERDDTGYVSIVEDHTRNMTMAEDFHDFINASYVDYSSKTCKARDYSVFTQGKSLFYATSLLIGENMKSKISGGWDYGVVIAPKYEKDDDYIATVYGCTPLAIPNTVKSTHVSAVILDALNYLGEESNVDAFYNIVLLGRVADQQDDVRMIELARSLIITSIANIYDEDRIDLHNQYAKAVTSTTPFAMSGKLESIQQVAEAGLDAVLEKYE